MGSAQNLEFEDSHSDPNRLQRQAPGPAIFFHCQAQGNFELSSVSANVSAVWGYTSAELLNCPLLWLERIHPQDLERIRTQLSQLSSETPESCEYRFQYQEGTYHWLQTYLLLVSDPEGNPVEIIGCSQAQSDDQSMQFENKLLQSIVESGAHVLSQSHYRAGMTKALAVVGAALGVDRVYIGEYSPASTVDAEGLTLSFAWAREGYSSEQMPWQEISHQFPELSGYLDLMANCPFVGITRLLSGSEQDLFLKASTASTLWLPFEIDHHFSGFVGLDDCQTERCWTSRTIHLLQTWAIIIGGALKHHQSEEKLVHDAFHDSLTGLPNRALFLNRLSQALHRSKRHPDSIFAVLFLDLDGFKSINDTLGHPVGDQLLVAIAKRLASCLRPGDTVSRIGGDEFVVLLNDLHGIGDATGTAQRLRYQVSRAFQLGEHEVFTDVSMGITLSSYGYTTVEQILGDADRAMYDAKTAGKGRYRLFKRES